MRKLPPHSQDAGSVSQFRILSGGGASFASQGLPKTESIVQSRKKPWKTQPPCPPRTDFFYSTPLFHKKVVEQTKPARTDGQKCQETTCTQTAGEGNKPSLEQVEKEAYQKLENKQVVSKRPPAGPKVAAKKAKATKKPANTQPAGSKPTSLK